MSKEQALFPVFAGKGKRLLVGYINDQGAVVIEPTFAEGGPIIDGMGIAAVNRKWGYVGASGEWIVQAIYSAARQGSEGAGAVERPRVGWGYVDRAGRLLVDPQYEYADPFREGYAFVRTHAGLHGFIDREGRSASGFVYEDCWWFSEGTAAVKRNGKWGFVDKRFEYVVEPEFEGDIGPCQDGLSRLRAGRSDAFIDRRGQVVFTIKGGEADEFCCGLARVDVGGLSGFIDVSGAFVLPPKYVFATRFSEGLCLARVGKKAGFINSSGNFVTPEVLTYATEFQRGISLVHTDKEIGYINRSGEFIWRGPFSRTAAGILHVT
jgi:hypothetical protein